MRTARGRTTWTALGLGVLAAMTAGLALAADPPDPGALARDLDALLAKADVDKAEVAACIVDLGTPGAPAQPRTVYSRLPDRPFVPASNMKLLTTAACFDRLGPDWAIRTHVGRVPSPRGKDTWDLAVIGGGDPNISGRFYGGDTVGAFRQWARVLKARGLARFERVVLDDTLFDAQRVHPSWPADQRGKWYEAPVNALPINDNCVNIHVSPGTVGGPARVWLEPPGSGIRLLGSIETVADRKAHVYSLERLVDANGMAIRAGGRFWVEAPERVEYRALADPTGVFGNALVATLRAEGIAIAGPVVRESLTLPSGAARRDFVCDLVHTSRLGATCAVANSRSQNLYAECLMKLLGAYALTPKVTTPKPPRQGTWDAGRQEIERWLSARGIPSAGCVIDDGSGLSKRNRVTAFMLARLLSLMDRVHGARWRATLAVAGDPDGSLRNRMRHTPAEGRVAAKTGYVLGASTLSGYAETDSGRRLAFAILVNGFRYGHLWKARLVQDKMCIRMVAY